MDKETEQLITRLITSIESLAESIDAQSKLLDEAIDIISTSLADLDCDDTKH